MQASERTIQTLKAGLDPVSRHQAPIYGVSVSLDIAHEAFATSAGPRCIPSRSLTSENLAIHRLDPDIAFWRELKHGAGRFYGGDFDGFMHQDGASS